ncbi:MAG TPA: hydroxymethylpyrimidine/phosphomethylpyrimidine kinase [Bacteroidales bacterium]|nr:hydroxymethylpyrimidine/phosphomethylpyrimidine kinase [Bacteroidales bacterium]
MPARPYVLIIAGFDPSSGAGITADLKTFEQHKVYGLGVCSAITFQNESEFEGVEWISPESIMRQLDILFSKYTIAFAKIGLIENLEVLNRVVDFLQLQGCKVVWDPILRASAGYIIHSDFDNSLLRSVLSRIYLLTPNLPEFDFIKKQVNSIDILDLLDQTHLNAILLKGGHAVDEDCCDVLYHNGAKTLLKGDRISGAKHGTGCVLSSAIVSNLASGYSLTAACKSAKAYVEHFISSNQTLLGYHS